MQNDITADGVLAADFEVITSDNLPPNDQQILNEFRRIPSAADEEDEEDGEMQIERANQTTFQKCCQKCNKRVAYIKFVFGE